MHRQYQGVGHSLHLYPPVRDLDLLSRRLLSSVIWLVDTTVILHAASSRKQADVGMESCCWELLGARLLLIHSILYPNPKRACRPIRMLAANGNCMQDRADVAYVSTGLRSDGISISPFLLSVCHSLLPRTWSTQAVECTYSPA